MAEHPVSPQVHPTAEVISLCSVVPKEAAFTAAMAEAITARQSPSTATFTQAYYTSSASAPSTSAPSTRNTTTDVIFPPSTNISTDVQQSQEGASYPPLLCSSTVDFDRVASAGGLTSPSITCVNQYYATISNNSNNTTPVLTHQPQQQPRSEGVEYRPFIYVVPTNTSNVTTCFPQSAQNTKNEQKYAREIQEQNAPPSDSKSYIALLNREDEPNGRRKDGACLGVVSSFSPPFSSNSPLAPPTADALPLTTANDESIDRKYSMSNRSNNANTVNSTSHRQHSSSGGGHTNTNPNEIDILTSVISRSKGKEVVLGADTCDDIKSDDIDLHHGGSMSNNPVGVSNDGDLGMAIQIGLQHKHSQANSTFTEERLLEECRPVLLYPSEQALNDSQSAGRSLTQSHHLTATRKSNIRVTHEPQSQIHVARGGSGSGACRQRQIDINTSNTIDTNNSNRTTATNNNNNAKNTTTNTKNTTDDGTHDNEKTLAAMASGGPKNANRNSSVLGNHYFVSDSSLSPSTNTKNSNPHLDDNSRGSPSRVHQQCNHLYNITATQHYPQPPPQHDHHHQQPPFILPTAKKFDINPNTTTESSTRPQFAHGPLQFSPFVGQHPVNPAHTGYASAEAIRAPGSSGGDAARSTDDNNNKNATVAGIEPSRIRGASNYDVAHALNASHRNQQQRLQSEQQQQQQQQQKQQQQQQQFYRQSSSQQPRTIQAVEQNASNTGLAGPRGNMMNLSLTDPPIAIPNQASAQPTTNTQQQQQLSSATNVGPLQQRQNQSAVAAYLPNTPYYPQVLPLPTAARPFSVEQQQQQNPQPLVAGGGVVHSAGTHTRGEAGLYPSDHSYSPSPFGSSVAVHPPSTMGGAGVAEQQQINLNHLYHQQIQEEQHRQLYHKQRQSQQQQHLQQQQQQGLGSSGLTISSSYSSLGQPSSSFGQHHIQQQNGVGLANGVPFAPQLGTSSPIALNSVPNNTAAASLGLFSYQQQQWIMLQQQQQQLLQQQHEQQMQRNAMEQQQHHQISYNYNNSNTNHGNNPLLTLHHAHGQPSPFLQRHHPFVSSSNVFLSGAVADPSTSSSGLQPPLLRHISIPNIAIPASSSSASLPASGSASTTPLMLYGMGGGGPAQGQGVSPFSTAVATPHQQRYLQLPSSSEQFSGALHLAIPTITNPQQQGSINVGSNGAATNGGGGAAVVVHRVGERSDQTSQQSQNVGIGPKSTPLSKQRSGANTCTSGVCFPSPAAEKRLPPPSASRRKTSYCNFYPERVHLCPFGDQCAYAHTREDRRVARERLRTKLIELEEQLQQEEAVKLQQQGYPQQDGVSPESAGISHSIEHLHT